MTKAVKRKPARRAARAEAKKGVAFLFGKGSHKTDPVLAAIEKHKGVCAVFERTRKVVSNMRMTNPRYKAAAAADHIAGSVQRNALITVLGCQPTTLRGVIAALEHVAQPEWLASTDYTNETVLSSITHYDESVVGEEIADLAKSFPLRLAAALRQIIGTETQGSLAADARKGKRSPLRR
jgi:hypothetical protein